jgi:hypothetical protein
MITDGAGGAYLTLKTSPDGATVFHTCPVTVAHLLPGALRDPAWDAGPVTGLYSDMEHVAPVLPLADGTLWVFGQRSGVGPTTPYLARRRDRTGVLLADVGTLPTPPGFVPTYSHFLRGPGGSAWLVRSRVDAVRFDPDGNMTDIPTPVPASSIGLFGPPGPTSAVAEDGEGGAYIVGGLSNLNSDAATQLTDLFVYRFTADGSLPWSPAMRVVTIAPRHQFEPQMIASATDGALIVWTDQRTLANGDDIYALKLLADGSIAPGWQVNGRAIAATTGLQFSPAIASDGLGGVWVSWIDDRAGGNDVYFTHVLADGSAAPGFPVNGRVLCAAPGTQVAVRLAEDGAGGFLCAWQDYRDGEADLYGSHITATGAVASGWMVDGSAVCTNPAAQGAPLLVATAPGRAFVAWLDSREGPQYAYALELTSGGPNLGAPPSVRGRLTLAPRSNPMRHGVDLLVSSADAGPIQLTLLDVSGRLLFERTLHGPLQHGSFHLDGVGVGLYFARARNSGGETVCRIAVVR